jgi:hypothetical protein
VQTRPSLRWGLGLIWEEFGRSAPPGSPPCRVVTAAPCRFLVVSPGRLDPGSCRLCGASSPSGSGMGSAGGDGGAGAQRVFPAAPGGRPSGRRASGRMSACQIRSNA